MKYLTCPKCGVYVPIDDSKKFLTCWKCRKRFGLKKRMAKNWVYDEGLDFLSPSLLPEEA